VNGRSRVLPRVILGGAGVAGLAFFAVLDVPYPDAEDFVPGAAGGIAVALLIGLLFLPARPLAWVLPLALLLTPIVWLGAYLVHISLFDTSAYPLARGLFIAVWALPIFVGTLALAQLMADLPLPRSAWLAGCAVVAAAIALVPPALTHAWEGPPKARFEMIDEKAGSYGGVGIGDSRTELAATFGEPEPRDENQPILPTGVDIDDDVEGPNFLPISNWALYPDVAFYLDRTNVRIIGFELTSPGAETTRGIEIGDDLGDAKRAYPELTCGTGDSGSDEPAPFHYCTGEVAPGIYLWFGGDEISSILVFHRPLVA
jgi:hypothetical protein